MTSRDSERGGRGSPPVPEGRAASGGERGGRGSPPVPEGRAVSDGGPSGGRGSRPVPKDQDESRFGSTNDPISSRHGRALALAVLATTVIVALLIWVWPSPQGMVSGVLTTDGDIANQVISINFVESGFSAEERTNAAGEFMFDSLPFDGNFWITYSGNDGGFGTAAGFLTAEVPEFEANVTVAGFSTSIDQEAPVIDFPHDNRQVELEPLPLDQEEGYSRDAHGFDEDPGYAEPDQ